MESPDGLDSRSSLELENESQRPILSHTDSMMSNASQPRRVSLPQPRQPAAPPVPQTVQESFVMQEDTQNLHLIERPSVDDVNEILSLLKVKTSMLALGACERVKKLAKAHPVDVIWSPILKELLTILRDGPATPLAGGAISALVALALVPEGRKHIVLLGGAQPIVKFLSRCDLNHGNTSRALQLLMNLAADASNRRLLREANAVEVVVQLMNKCQLGPLMAHAIGALHNIMLTDSKAKQRAVDAGVVSALARVLASEQAEGAILGVRAHMLISDLLRVDDMQARLISAAQAQGLYIPGLMPAPVKRKPAQAPPPNHSADGTPGEEAEGVEASELGSTRSSVTTPIPGEGQQQQEQEGNKEGE